MFGQPGRERVHVVAQLDVARLAALDQHRRPLGEVPGGVVEQARQRHRRDRVGRRDARRVAADPRPGHGGRVGQLRRVGALGGACHGAKGLREGGTSDRSRLPSRPSAPRTRRARPRPREASVTSPPDAFERSRRDVDAALETALGRLLPRLAALHPALGPAGDHLVTFLDGGKRVRPTLLLLGYAAGGGTDRSAVLGPALALELLHTCALLHDDVIDRAPTRRGRPTVHHAVAATHRDRGWAGDALGYGEAVAILLGDLAFVQADELFLEAGVAPDALLAGFRRFTVLREEVMAGQYLDLHAATARLTDRDLALAIATLKSGRYSVRRPLEIGASLAGAGPALVDGLGRVGEPLGVAFQLRDDLLGVFGDEVTTGKSVAGDLAEGKRTLLVAEAVARLSAAERDELEAGLGDPDLTPQRAARLRDLLETSGARRATEDHLDAAVDAARAALGDLGLPPAAAADLADVAHYLGARTT
ncbi:polyprenyl synthetase family protein [Nitriliruptoraceae bacterium ZYF776]|nr:polyprenyl synthetase family protein [Profundirhabdus halotolerans]